jgi:diguanylate cyclase (GGDEF)-like protein
MSIDYSTIHLCNSLLNLSYAGMLLALWWRRREPELLLWASSLLLVSAAVYGFTLSRNAFLVACLLAAVSANISLTWSGARAFDGRKPFHWHLCIAPIATFSAYVLFARLGSRIEGSAVATTLLAANVAIAGRYFIRHGDGYARKSTGWVLAAYAPLYIASLTLDLVYSSSQMSAILILVGDFVLNNAFVVGLFAMMEERARDELRKLAVTDQLTGALNRAGLMAKLSDNGFLTGRALLLADLDHFKGVNDAFGHTGGDMALRTFVSRTSMFLRPDEFVARLGGEEFAILVQAADMQQASDRAEEIRTHIASEPVMWGWTPIVLTTSIGVAVADQSDTLETLMTRADEALYRAKRTGRNRVAA